jgi:IS6 family transposase
MNMAAGTMALASAAISEGQWRYLYRTVDQQVRTVDFLLSKNRDQAAAVSFFTKAFGSHELRKRSHSTAVRRPTKPSPN